MFVYFSFNFLHGYVSIVETTNDAIVLLFVLTGRYRRKRDISNFGEPDLLIFFLLIHFRLFEYIPSLF